MSTKTLFDASSLVVLQHSILTSGKVLNGTEIGRATATSGSSTAALTFSARQLGTYGNGIVVNLIDPKTPTAAPRIVWNADTRVLDIFLKWASGAPTSTAIEIAAAVGALYGKGYDVLCTYGSTGLGTVVAAAAITLAGGVDPVVSRQTTYNFTKVVDGGGLLYFGQTVPIVIDQIDGLLGSSTSWTLDIVTLDEGLQTIAAETVRVTGATGTSVFLANQGIILPPLRALSFKSAITGVIRAYARKA